MNDMGKEYKATFKVAWVTVVIFAIFCALIGAWQRSIAFSMIAFVVGLSDIYIIHNHREEKDNYHE